MNYINVEPSPESLISSLRDIGYSFETAVADIIDNSITAKASRIDLRFSWNFGCPWFSIIDNGEGMNNEDLILSMKFGSKNPLDERDSNDLGRFGLGMKTASFSQCRNLIVTSKKNAECNIAEWDLDYIVNYSNNSWSLKFISDIESTDISREIKDLYEEYLKDHESGTIIFWKNIDRIETNDTIKSNENHFNETIAKVRKHIELTFHRFLSPDLGQSKIRIFMNNDELESYNPFFPTASAIQELPTQDFVINGNTIKVQPYVLPHHSKVSKEEYQRYAGENGYLHNQGFY
ncbi:MAG: ATP-binding protein, partial [Candidatus Delongbacteria bacterium]|nr:ATP-binding protein [Candidatus Delongbacteria bacterium]